MVNGMIPRFATPDDRDAIAKLHVQAWQETYPGLVPDTHIARMGVEMRQGIWGQILDRGMEVSYLPGIGFAHLGRHRDDALRETYPNELYSLYTLRSAHGQGAAQALLAHAIGSDFVPFTASVLKGNARATRFYEKIGGQRVTETKEEIDGKVLTDIVFGYPVPIQLAV